MQLIPVFTDVIKVLDGRFCDAELHAQRICKTINHFFAKQPIVSLSDDLVPVHLRTGLVKCRIDYSYEILNIEFTPYLFRQFDRMVVVKDDAIEYGFKYLDRSCFADLQGPCDKGDEILIVKGGLVTDTSYSNVVFEDSSGKFFTPSVAILYGLKRRNLLDHGRVRECVIREEDIWSYRKMYLINAMIDLQDNVCVACSDICIP